MDALTPLAVQAIAGLIGGGIAGNLIEAAAIRTSPKVLVSLIGGVAVGALAALAFGAGQIAMTVPDPSVTAEAAARLDVGALLAWIGGGLLGGGIATTTAGVLGFGR